MKTEITITATVLICLICVLQVVQAWNPAVAAEPAPFEGYIGAFLPAIATIVASIGGWMIRDASEN